MPTSRTRQSGNMSSRRGLQSVRLRQERPYPSEQSETYASFRTLPERFTNFVSNRWAFVSNQ
jgi:hypothetical protein